MTRTLTILGSTGSIGTSTLDVVRRNRDRFPVHALVAGSNVELLVSQINEFRPRVAVVADSGTVERLSQALELSGIARNEWPEIAWGAQARVDAATTAEVDFVISAIVGVTGLEATYKAVRAGKTVGLANKEVLVASGKLVMQAARESNVELLPVDSEHNGAHQCLRAGRRREVTRLILTASGGPFRETPRERLEEVTPAEALNHPTWKMGRRITVDSATLMNKGFEVIEACWLFDFQPSEIDVVIHPQSSVHALIEFTDGSVLAQISATDMRMPIQYALTYPERDMAPVPRMNWTERREWQFMPPDLEKFPLLRLAYEAQQSGGSATCTLNAADEVAVSAFLEGRIRFTEIYNIVAETLDRVATREHHTIDQVLETDSRSRVVAAECVERRGGSLTLQETERLVKA